MSCPYPTQTHACGPFSSMADILNLDLVSQLSLDDRYAQVNERVISKKIKQNWPSESFRHTDVYTHQRQYNQMMLDNYDRQHRVQPLSFVRSVGNLPRLNNPRQIQ
jgi:hypothetical protein